MHRRIWTGTFLMMAAMSAAAFGEDGSLRYEQTERPDLPEAQHPPAATQGNVDTGKPVQQWQRLTDDWFGTRPWLDDHGVSWNASLTGYLGGNLTGGQERGGGAAYKLNLNLTLDTEKLMQWRGGTFFVNFRQQDGLSHSRDGAFQNTSDLYSERRTEISELWYEQKLFDDKLRIKFGKIDATGDFAQADHGDAFLNSSVETIPTILDLPTDPDPAFGLEVFANPTDHFYAGMGVFDGALAEGVKTGANGPRTLFNKPSDLFFIAETGVTWELGEKTLSGKLGVGAWHHTGTFSRFDSGTQHGATGLYIVGSQMLWKPDDAADGDDRGISVFAHFGWAEPSISEATEQVSAGVTWTGMIHGRDEDVTGIGVDWTRFAAGEHFARNDEVTVEGFYQVRVLKWLSVKPDVQYTINPGGESGRNSLSGVLQVIIDF